MHVNVLLFQQMLACELEDGDVTRPIRVTPSKWAMLLPYWLTRITAALREGRASAGGEHHGHTHCLDRHRAHSPLPLPTDSLSPCAPRHLSPLPTDSLALGAHLRCGWDL